MPQIAITLIQSNNIILFINNHQNHNKADNSSEAILTYGTLWTVVPNNNWKHILFIKVSDFYFVSKMDTGILAFKTAIYLRKIYI